MIIDGKKIVILAILMGLFCFGCSKCNEWLGLKDDNDGEEIIEQIIKNQTGMDLDLTPQTPE